MLAECTGSSCRSASPRFDCGISDPYIEQNRLLHRRFEAQGILHHYAEKQGKHDWAYWIANIAEHLRFHYSL
ncbi:alpha/beta hydrolase-fold protein [Paenibacillus sp. J2TS4]|uniref:alpha/beta hydrolase-fold protein n=1 Tax=Paenibacillus sp. J2TS4 TaxID=2807194 RepID=UPI0035B505B9